MDNVNHICCAWVTECKQHHDSLLRALNGSVVADPATSQAFYDELRHEVELQNNRQVLPYPMIPAVHFGKLAQAHSEDLPYDALVVAYSLAQMHKPIPMEGYRLETFEEAANV